MVFQGHILCLPGFLPEGNLALNLYHSVKNTTVSEKETFAVWSLGALGDVLLPQQTFIHPDYAATITMASVKFLSFLMQTRLVSLPEQQGLLEILSVRLTH